MQTMQFYSKLYYESRVKALVDAEWPQLVAQAGSKGAPMPKRLKLQNSILDRVWQAETNEFRAAVQAQRDTEFEEELAAWKMSKLDVSNASMTAQEYAQ